MSKLLYENKQFKILLSHDYVVVRKDFPYGYHSHFKKYSGAIRLLKLFDKKLIPQNEYFRVALERIATSEELEVFKEQKAKQMYYNVNKGKNRRK